MNLKFMSRIYANVARHTAQHIATNLDLPLQFEARDSSARYAADNMAHATRFTSREAMLSDAVKRVANIEGCICEFGVFNGHTLKLLANAAQERNVHGFDSFEGLPANWRPGFSKGLFKTHRPAFPGSNIQLHVGLFEATLPQFLEHLKEPICLVHIDCDLYSSTRCVLDNIIPRLAPGAILVFDEYFNYPGWQEHEHRALRESVEGGDLAVEYLAFNLYGEQVMAQAFPGGTKIRNAK